MTRTREENAADLRAEEEDKNVLRLEGDDCLYYVGWLPEDMFEALLACGQPELKNAYAKAERHRMRAGADEAVAEFLRYFTVEVDTTTAVKYLSSTGGWEDYELLDHDANVERLVWMAGCQLRETEDEREAYFCFSTY